jgi:hypothetical protein
VTIQAYNESCDQTFAFDTTLKLKGEPRSFVIIASGSGKHVAKPY